MATIHSPEAQLTLSIPPAHPLSPPPSCYIPGRLRLLQRAGFPLVGQPTSVGTTDKVTVTEPAPHSIAHIQWNIGKKKVLDEYLLDIIILHMALVCSHITIIWSNDTENN